MILNPFHSHPPKGSATDVLEKRKNPLSRLWDKYEYFFANSAYQRDSALWIAKGSILIIAICVVSNIYFVSNYSTKTYVVRVNDTTGAIDTTGPLKASNYEPKEAEIKHFLAQWILDTRNIPLDPVAFNNNMTTAQHFMTNEAATKYLSLIQNDNPAAKLGKFTVQPTIKSIQLQPGSKATYQVRWTEDTFSLTGNSTNKKVNYVALFSIGIDPPTKEEELMINPLGLKIRDLTLSIESETSTPNTTIVTTPHVNEPQQEGVGK